MRTDRWRSTKERKVCPRSWTTSSRRPGTASTERLFTAEEVARATRASRPTAEAAYASVSTDTRTLAPGALYLALKGDRFDGHSFLAEAAAKGAAAAIVRKGTQAVSGLSLFEVEDTLLALGALAAFHRRRFSIPIGAVGGSNGKTTTKEMVAAILRTRGPALATEGNLNNEVGVPLTLLRLTPEHRSAVLELGMSEAGELARLAAMADPDAGVLTLIAAEHLEFLKNLDGVAEAEGELYRGLRADATAVVNADDPRCVAQAAGIRRKLCFGRGPGTDVRLSRVRPLGVEGQEIFLEGEERKILRRITVRLGFVGEHNAMNAAAAAALALSLSYTFEEISRGLSLARPYAHRSRVVAGAGEITILDDCYNASPASMEAALATLTSLCESGRAIAVLGDMLELGAFEEEAHRTLGKKARESVELAAFFGPRSHFSFEEYSSSPSSRSSAHFTEIDPLLSWLKARLVAGDVLLVKGSRGMKLERVVDALSKETT